MRAAFVSFLVLLLASLAVGAERPAMVPGDAQDLVLFLDSHPCLIRLHVQINGKSFRRNWDETIGNLFRYLDANGDGVLGQKEAALAPSRTQWVQLMTGATVEPDSAPEFEELAGSSSGNTIRQEPFVRYYSNSGGGALQVEWGWRPPAQDYLTDALFARLDQNKDGVLSRAELMAAPARLHPLDINGDDLIQEDELAPRGAYPVFTFRSATDEQPVPKTFPFAILPNDSPATKLAGEIRNRYDRDKDGKISRAELPLDKGRFKQLDADGNGNLEASELASWRKLPPELELLMPLEPNSRKDILILPTANGKPNPLLAQLPPSRDGAVRVPIAEKQLELVRDNRGSAMRQELMKKFDSMAGKGDLLNEKVIYQPPFFFVALLRLADRNRDNQLSRQELKEYLDAQEKFLFRTSHLTVVDRGPSLFEFIDVDHDRRLSPRELRSAWQRLAPWSQGDTGRITRQQVPRQFQLVFSYGQSYAIRPEPGPGFDGVPLFRDRSRGPLWFRKMDRNGDGDVSPGEFLGSKEQFRRLDRDGDGLIDVTEAEQADQEMRKRR
jgi:Ca2+-binding EF-hand superfamily protein